MPTATLSPARTAPQSRPRTSPELRRRAEVLLRSEIDFIPNPTFDAADELDGPGAAAAAPPELPLRMGERDVLTQQQETALFREMNFLKYKANVLRSRIDLEDVDPRLVAATEALVRRALVLRDHIVEANMRLVMSIAKKFVTPQRPFDEMLSDGLITLMRVVEKFDYDRGFRFSTYAYRSIVRNAYRMSTAAREEEARYLRDADDWAFEQPGDGSSSRMTDQMWHNLRELAASMLDQLDRRERLIVRSRYALGSHRKVRTFQDLARRLGVSKERVRQLEQRAVAKLRNMAARFEMDKLFNAAIV